MNFRDISYAALLATGILLGASCNKSKEPEEPATPGHPEPKEVVITVRAANLEFPWGLALLPNGDLLFTERYGRFSLLRKDSETPALLTTRQVQLNSEGGLLGLALDPDFGSNHFVYAYETTTDNRVVRYRFENDQLSEDKVILQGIPKAGNHNGGVLQFGPDGYLYVGTGDAQTPSSAQNLQSLAGKILRLDREGNPAPGNPFSSHIWTYGHRNVQGITWDQKGNMFASEHGPSGDLGSCCHDELNRIVKGRNYGWPLAHKSEEKDTLARSIAESGTDTWAPSGCLFTGNSLVWPDQLVLACLRGKRFERFSLNADGTGVSPAGDTLSETFGRLRNIIKGQDGSLIFCSSNGNDQILEILAE